MVSELFFCQISWNSTATGSLEIGKFLQKQSVNFLSSCACAAFNWVLSILKDPRIAGFFASLPFLTHLCYKRLQPSTHYVQLWRKIAKIEQALSTKNDRCINWMFVFCNPCARAESQQQELARKLCSATLS